MREISIRRTLSAALAAVLLLPAIFGCAQKEEEVTLEAIAAANSREALLADGAWQVRYHGPEGFEETKIFTPDECYQKFRAGASTEEGLSTGEGECSLITYDDGTEEFSVVWYAMEPEEQAEIRVGPDAITMPGIDTEFERLISSAKNADGTLTVQTEEEIDGEAMIRRSTYILDAETLQIKKSEFALVYEDGTQETLLSYDCEKLTELPQDMCELRERYAALGTVSPRTLTLIYDAGTAEERQYTLTADQGIPVQVIPAGDCFLCGDPSGKALYYGEEYDKDVTVYAVRPKTPEEMLAVMSLRDKIGQMVMPAFRTWEDGEDKADVTALNDEIRAAISKNRFGGIILFAENCAENVRTLEFVSELQTANQQTASDVAIPLLIAIDQEGGSVARLGQGTRMIGNMALGATGDPENAYRAADMISDELDSLGINTDFAPVLDVNDNPANPVIGVRSFSDDPEIAAQFGVAYIQGLKEWDIISALKHFPGHGNTESDSHTGLPMVNKTLDELRECELIPFAAGIEAGADMVMTAHIQYPQIESATYPSVSTGEEVYVPATLSRAILTDLLRGEMGFEGVVVSDALEMAAIREHFAPLDVVRMAIEAGVDLFLMPVTVTDAESLAALEQWIDDVAALAESGEIDMSRIDESVLRILRMKEAYGLLNPIESRVNEHWRAVLNDYVGSEENHDVEWELMQKAVTLLRNDRKAVPYSVSPGDRVVLFYSGESRMASAEFARQRLVQEGLVPADAVFETVSCTPEAREACARAAREADHVIVVSTLFGIGELDPAAEEGAESAVIDEIIAAAHESGKPVALISGHLPYDAARYPEADAILLNYGSAAMPTLPENGGAYPPNIPAAICAVFGEFEPQGRLPVNLPRLDEQYHLTDAILYARGSSAE